MKYQAAAFAHTDDTLYVNLYMPTTVTWDEKNITVKQETNFPSEHSKLTVTGSGEFTMKVRVPLLGDRRIYRKGKWRRCS